MFITMTMVFIKLLLKFRKNVISDDLIDIGWQSYKDLAKPSRGRGASAGPIRFEKVYIGLKEILWILKNGQQVI